MALHSYSGAGLSIRPEALDLRQIHVLKPHQLLLRVARYLHLGDSVFLVRCDEVQLAERSASFCAKWSLCGFPDHKHVYRKLSNVLRAAGLWLFPDTLKTCRANKLIWNVAVTLSMGLGQRHSYRVILRSLGNR